MPAPLTTQGARHETAVVSSGTGGLHIRSAKKPSTQGVEAGGSTFLRVGECGAWDSAEHSFGVSAWKPNIHLRDTLPCAFTKAESISDTGDMANANNCVWSHCDEAKAGYGLHGGGACAEHRTATTECVPACRAAPLLGRPLGADAVAVA
ncbi:hypothetical protein MTO96_015895 [Rhipicephalus appendiculatus]